MPESFESRRRKLQEALRAHGAQLPPDLARLADALWNDTDAILSHEECLAALPTFVMSEMGGAPVAQRYPAVKHHLDRCDSCATRYAELMQVALADESGQLPQPAHLPEPDLSFLPPLHAKLPDAPVPEWLALFQAHLRGLFLSPNVSLGGAFAKTVTPKIEDGQTDDGVLRWRIVEDDDRNLIIRLGSHKLDLEGVRLRLNAGGWQRELVLTRVAADQVGAETVLLQKERAAWKGAETPLTIEFAHKAKD